MGLFEYEGNINLRIIIQLFVNLVAVITLAWFIVYGFCGQTIVTGSSMSTVLESDDMCLVNRISYALGNPARYDIVLFKRTDNGQEVVKRVVGLPGETVQIVSGSVYINNRKLDDSRIGSITQPGIAQNPVVLQKNEYFLIGDNADSSEDSRFVSIGNVSKKDIIGRVWFRLKPASEIGFVQ